MQKASDAEVKAFAQHMIAEHSKTNNELAVMASRREIPVPDTMDVYKQAAYLSVSQEPAIVFDKKYIDELVAAHNLDLAKYDSASRFLDDGEIREWAGKQIPALKNHLEMAKQLDIKTNNQ